MLYVDCCKTLNYVKLLVATVLGYIMIELCIGISYDQSKEWFAWVYLGSFRVWSKKSMYVMWSRIMVGWSMISS